MPVKSSAHYQREHRRRLREQGLVKKEVWIKPEHTELIRDFEKNLRNAQQIPENLKAVRPAWLTQALFTDLKKSSLVKDAQATIELIDGAEPSLLIIMHEFGDLPQYLNIAGEQIIVESVLWPVNDVKDVANFNEIILRTHKYFPLSTISIGNRAEQDYYLMFGSLSASSSLEDIVYCFGN